MSARRSRAKPAGAKGTKPSAKPQPVLTPPLPLPPPFPYPPPYPLLDPYQRLVPNAGWTREAFKGLPNKAQAYFKFYHPSTGWMCSASSVLWHVSTGWCLGWGHAWFHHTLTDWRYHARGAEWHHVASRWHYWPVFHQIGIENAAGYIFTAILPSTIDLYNWPPDPKKAESESRTYANREQAAMLTASRGLCRDGYQHATIGRIRRTTVRRIPLCHAAVTS
jgi:hypothetical protein